MRDIKGKNWRIDHVDLFVCVSLGATHRCGSEHISLQQQQQQQGGRRFNSRGSVLFIGDELAPALRQLLIVGMAHLQKKNTAGGLNSPACPSVRV